MGWKLGEIKNQLIFLGNLLEQDPAATEEAASFGGKISFGEKISFGGKKLRQSYDVVARLQLESRANHDF